MKKPVATFLLAGIVAAICFVFLPQALAQEAAPPNQAHISALDVIKAGGTIGYIIILLSFIAMGLIVENLITLRSSALVPKQFLVELFQLIEKGAYGQAREFCSAGESYIAKIMEVSLARRGLGAEAMLRAGEEAIREETTKLVHKTGLLYLIASIAPMLGLLGTVVGLIMAFFTIAQTSGPATPAKLAGPIMVALVTTADGLVVAIPALIAYYFFQSKITRVSIEAGAFLDQLLTPLQRRAKAQERSS